MPPRHRRFAPTFDWLERRELLAANLGLLVQLYPGQSTASVGLDPAASRFRSSLEETGIAGLWKVSGNDSDLANVRAAVGAHPGVMYTEFDSLFEVSVIPSDASNLYGMVGANGIRAHQAWDSVTGSTTVVVADIDSGVDYNHIDLYKNIWINQNEIPASRRSQLTDVDADGLITFWDLNEPINQGPFKITDLNGDGRISGYDVLRPTNKSGNIDLGTGGWADAVDQDADGKLDAIVGWDFLNNDNDPMDDNNHGTHTTGTIAAMGNNGYGVAGVMWKAQIMPLKFLGSDGSGPNSGASASVRWAAEHGARISSNSYGSNNFSTTFRAAISYAGTFGHIFVAGAGNDGANNDTNPFYPAAYDLPNILAVAATNSSGTLAGFSNYGVLSVDLAAPGVGIQSTIPNNNYASYTGTSMAAPHVAGVAGLVLSQFPSWSYAQVVERIKSAVTSAATLQGTTATGGIVNAFAAIQTPTSDLSWLAGGLNLPANADADEPFTVPRTYVVSGQAIAPNFTIKYYVSRDTIFGNADDLLLASESISSAAGKAVGSHSGTSPSLSIDRGGTAYVFAKIDADNALLEIDEANNTTAGGGIFVEGPQIVDNADPNFSTTGEWIGFASAAEFQGTMSYSAAGSGVDAAIWASTVTPGIYQVMATWSPYANRATNAPFAILDGSNVLASVSVNQRVAPDDVSASGSSWEFLATSVNVFGTNLTVRLSDLANGYVIADAVRIVRVGDLPTNAEVEVLDGSASLTTGVGTIDFGTSQAGASVANRTFTVRNQGSQTLHLGDLQVPAGYVLVSNFGETSLTGGASTTFSVRRETSTLGTFAGDISFTTNDADENPFRIAVTGKTIRMVDQGNPGYATAGGWTNFGGGFGNSYQYAAAGTGTATATWTLPAVPGMYRVSASWVADPNRATNAPFTISDGSMQIASLSINQRLAPSDFTEQGVGFKDLGANLAIFGNSVVVRLTNAANGFVIADAIRLERVGELPVAPEVSVFDGAASLTSDVSSLDLGSTYEGSSIQRTFTIRNSGGNSLTLGTPSLPSGYVLTAAPAASVAAGATTAFTVAVPTSATPGTYAGQISIATNDNDEYPFRFQVSAVIQAIPTIQILDNGDAGFATVGSWVSGVSEGYGNDISYSAAGSGADQATWTFAVRPGLYRVAMTYSAATNRTSDARVTVSGVGPANPLSINQQVAPNDFSAGGATWETLGDYYAFGNALTVTIADRPVGFTIADAVRIERIGSLPVGSDIQILDGSSNLSTGANLDLGSLATGQTANRTLTLRNLGDQNLVLASAQITGGFSLGAISPTTLAPGQSTTFQVSFTAPSGGTFAGTLTIPSNDPDESPFTLNLAAQVVQIIDDGDAGFSTTGNWQPSGGGFQSDHRYSAAGTGTDAATWTFAVSPGVYDVAIHYAEHSNRATNSPFYVFDGGTPIGATTINQRVAANDFNASGANWERLGSSFTVFGNSLVVRLTDAADGFVVADGVRVVRVGNLPAGPEIRAFEGANELASASGTVNLGSGLQFGGPLDRTFTVRNAGQANLTLGPLQIPSGYTLLTNLGSNNLAPGATTTFAVRLPDSAPGTIAGNIVIPTNDPDENPFTIAITGTIQSLPSVQIVDDGDARFSTVGSWTAAPEGFGGDIRYSAAGSGTDAATWTFSATPGVYRVSVAYAAFSNRATNSPYSVYDGATLRGTVAINQQLAPNDRTDGGAAWEDLGSNFFVFGSSLVVRLSDQANNYVIADGVRVERLADLPANPEIQVRDGSNDLAAGSAVDFGAVALGSTGPTRTFTVTNVGGSALTLGTVQLPAGFSLASAPAASLAPGASTTIGVRFEGGTFGNLSGALSIATNDANENPFTLQLSGRSVRTLDDGDLGFSTSGVWATYADGFQGDLRYRVAGSGSNTANWAFSVSPGMYRVAASWAPGATRASNASYQWMDGSFQVGSAALNQQLSPNDFTFANANWEYLGAEFAVLNNSVNVRLTDQANGQVIADGILLERTGDLPAAPEIQLFETTELTSGAAVAFGTIDRNAGPAIRTFTVRNAGQQNLTLGSITAPDGFSVSSQPGSNNLAAAASTTFAIRLSDAAVGSFSGNLQLATNDSNENPFTLALSGTVQPRPTTQYLDDGGPSVSLVGAWTASTGEGYLGDVRFSAAGAGNDVATWSAAVEPGHYRVSVTYSPFSNRATNSPFSVLDGTNLLGTVAINQQLAPNDRHDQGVAWEDLGSNFLVLGTTLNVRLSDLANNYVIADGVRIEKIGNLAQGAKVQVLDANSEVVNGGSVNLGGAAVGTAITKTLTVKNLGQAALELSQLQIPTGFTLVSGFGVPTLATGASTTFAIRLTPSAIANYSGTLQFTTNDTAATTFQVTLAGQGVRVVDNGDLDFATVGSWVAFSEGHQNDIHYAAAGSGTSIATWTLQVDPGTYRVAATWTPHSNRATNAPFTILDGTTSLGTVAVNQEQAPADFMDMGVGWKYLGTTFTVTGTTLTVRLTNLANEFVIADAIRLERA